MFPNSDPVKLNEIYRKTKEGENIEELRTELQNTHEKKSHEELDAELMNIENMLIGLQDQGLTDDEVGLIEKITAQMNTDRSPPNLNLI